MTKLTYRKREKLPNSAFLLPKYRKLPYKKANGEISLSHVRNALARADQVVGVPQREINAAIKKAERILLEHGGYERNTMRKNFFGRKPKAPPTAAEQKAAELEELRSTRVWMDKYRYFNVSEGYTKAEAERAADHSTKEYWATRRKQQSSGIARNGRKRGKMRRNGSEVELYANPYDTSHTGFYFKDYDDFVKKYDAKYKKSRVEEYEIDFIDGDEIAQLLFNGMGVNQANIEEYFDQVEAVEDMSDHEKPGFFWLVDDRDLQSALDNYEEVMVFEGSLEDAAYDYFDSMGEIDQANVEMYFDYDKFGRELSISGDDVQGAIEEIEDLREQGDTEEADKLQDWVDTMEGMTDQERGEEYIESIGSLEDALGKNVSNYFDYEAFGRDADLNGDWTEFRFDGTNYVILNASGL